ncbi:hypothetical protein ACLOJK_012925 [Asimina triloba]
MSVLQARSSGWYPVLTTWACACLPAFADGVGARVDLEKGGEGVIGGKEIGVVGGGVEGDSGLGSWAFGEGFDDFVAEVRVRIGVMREEKDSVVEKGRMAVEDAGKMISSNHLPDEMLGFIESAGVEKGFWDD